MGGHGGQQPHRGALPRTPHDKLPPGRVDHPWEPPSMGLQRECQCLLAKGLPWPGASSSCSWQVGGHLGTPREGFICGLSHRNFLLPAGWAETSSHANAPQKERSYQTCPHPVRTQLHLPHDGMLWLQPGPPRQAKAASHIKRNFKRHVSCGHLFQKTALTLPPQQLLSPWVPLQR